MRKILSNFLTVLLGSIITIVVCHWNSPNFLPKNKTNIPPKPKETWFNPIYATTPALAAPLQTANFISVAEKAMPAAVHIKTKIYDKEINPFDNSTDNFWKYDFFGKNNNNTPKNQQKDFSSGSGVIISTDGYIITNGHVIENADEIEVILNDKRAFKAQVKGTDPYTDLAILKIDAPNLTALPFGNSDNVHVGEWVMAVGNPFRLSSTVTTGIVSAKARNIDILEDRLAIESFIQTDAAVNPGNSGGALVNLAGELIGINTAIATPTGYYAGYAFAVPANIAQKVAIDIIREGNVKRGFLGISVRDIDQNLASELNLTRIQGVYVAKVIPKGAAQQAGIIEGDIITHIADISVNSPPELQEIIGRYHPNDVLNISIIRQNTPQKIRVILKDAF